MSNIVREFAGPDPTRPDIKSTFSQKGKSKFFDPCAEASKASMKCLDRNDYDKEKCADFFRAYRECKSRWLEDRKEDRRRGL